MTISISNLTVNNNVPAGTVIGVLTAYDASSNVIPCNFTLTKNSAGFFAISENSLVTERASILAGIYSVRVHANGTTTRFSGSAVFHFNVPLQPYVLGGAGALRSSRDINIKNFVQFPVLCCLGSGQNIGSVGVGQFQIKQTDAEVHAGAGIRIPIAFGVAFRPEVRIVRAGNLHLVHGIFALS